VTRELQEELGILLQSRQLQYLGTHSMRYPYQGRDTLVMCIIYYTYITDIQKEAITINDDVDGLLRVNESTFDPSLMVNKQKTNDILQLFQIIKSS
jgi:8-oxo-dGTP pyrophosphatase MutT (NUDIX family)